MNRGDNKERTVDGWGWVTDAKLIAVVADSTLIFESRSVHWATLFLFGLNSDCLDSRVTIRVLS